MRSYRTTPGFCACGHQGRTHTDDSGPCRKCDCVRHERPQCSVADCSLPTKGLVYCTKHVLRARRHGDPLAGGPPRGRTAAQRFWAQVAITDSCWLWTGALDHLGYARFRVYPNEPKAMVHRFAYEFVNGPIPSGMELDHLCRIRCCVNPSHLEPVTHRENSIRSRAHMREFKETAATIVDG